MISRPITSIAASIELWMAVKSMSHEFVVVSVMSPCIDSRVTKITTIMKSPHPLLRALARIPTTKTHVLYNDSMILSMANVSPTNPSFLFLLWCQVLSPLLLHLLLWQNEELYLKCIGAERDAFATLSTSYVHHDSLEAACGKFCMSLLCRSATCAAGQTRPFRECVANLPILLV